MKPPRVSIAGLMAVVLISAIGVAAVRSASEEWAAVVVSTALFSCGLAILGAIYREGPRRAFWIGFALFGWGYLALAFGPWFATEFRPFLASSVAIDALHARLNPTEDVVLGATIAAKATTPFSSVERAVRMLGDQNVSNLRFEGAANNSAPINIVLTTTPGVGSNREEFRRIGHGLTALLAALAGGLAARSFSPGRDRSPCPDDARSATLPSTT